MDVQIIEPNPLLVEYFNKKQEIIDNSNLNIEQFDKDGEWHYVESSIEANILLLKRLESRGLLSDKINLCDCGIGYGTILYDLYLQSKEFINKEFTFTGIEKCDDYINSVRNDLWSYWDGNLNLIHGDIFDYDYSNMNLIWIYTPFRVSHKLLSFFEKVIDEVPVNSIIIGIDQFTVMSYGTPSLIEKFNKLEFNNIDGLIVYKKVI
jgi:hypothetical protein